MKKLLILLFSILISFNSYGGSVGIAEEELNKKLALIPPETELQKAQNFLSDFQVYFASNADEFDIEKVFEFMQQSKPILDGSFKSKDRKNIEAFKQFAETSSDFRVFRKNQLELETQEELKKINRLMISLSTNIKNLESKRKNNSLFSTLILIFVLFPNQNLLLANLFLL